MTASRMSECTSMVVSAGKDIWWGPRGSLNIPLLDRHNWD